MRRRRFLAAGLSLAVAGCASGSNETPAGASGSGGDDAQSTPGDGETLATHPATTSLDSQPRLGPSPGEATGTIVAFEDPSCPRCRAFEQTVVPEIRSNLTDSGAATYVVRPYPVIYDWGEPAVRALEATHDRDAEAFWQLFDHYFDAQDAFKDAGADEVYPRTEAFLADSTDLDAAAVVEAAENGAVESDVQTNLDAGEAAAVGRTTPHVFLFRDGRFRTRASGSISYSVIESALEL